MGVGSVHMEARCLRAGAGKGPGRHGGVEGGVGGGRQCRPCQRTRGQSSGKDGVGQLESIVPGENRPVGHVGTRDPFPLPCRGKVSGRNVRLEGLKGQGEWGEGSRGVWRHVGIWGPAEVRWRRDWRPRVVPQVAAVTIWPGVLEGCEGRGPLCRVHM